MKNVSKILENMELYGTVRLNSLECGSEETSVKLGGRLIHLIGDKTKPFQSFKTSPEVIRRAVMLYVRFPLSLRNVEDLLHGGCFVPAKRR